MPDPITWYTLGRTVDDTESILEAVDTKMLVHNLDPSAHGQENESIYDHRVAAELDHLLGSVSMKFLVADKFIISTPFNTFDGWDTAGAYIEPRIIDAVLRTGSFNTNEAYAKCASDASNAVVDFSKNPYFQTSVCVGLNVNQIAYFCIGDPYAGSPYNEGFGFKVNDGLLYAYWTHEGAAHTHEITGITLTDINVYRAFLDSTAGELYFYINGVLKHTVTTDLPTQTVASFFTYYIKTQEDSYKALYLIDLYLEMEH